MKYYRKEYTELQKANKFLETSNRLLIDKRNLIESEQLKIRNTLGLMNRDIDLYHRRADDDKREIENLQRERDILQKNIKRAESEYRFSVLETPVQVIHHTVKPSKGFPQELVYNE